MTHIFDGREFAKKREESIKNKVRNLVFKPKLVSIIVGDDPASLLYVNLKKKAAERVGAEVEIVKLNKLTKLNELIKLIQKYNNDRSVSGIMVQLPLPENFSKEDRDEVLNTISPEKDVDGLREDSKFTAPTAKAVLEVLKLALLEVRPLTKRLDLLRKVAVVGASGFEGKNIIKALEQEYKQSLLFHSKNKGIQGKELEIIKADSKTENLKLKIKNCDVVISVTGVPDLITADMVKSSAILIDVGSPKGDIEKSAYDKAAFVSPVPGGVGPITISCLLENLVEASSIIIS